MNASSTNPTTFINQTDHTNHTSLFLLFLEHDNQPKTACLSLSTNLLKKATQPPRTTVCIYTYIIIYIYRYICMYVWLIRLNRPTNDPPQLPKKTGKPSTMRPTGGPRQSELKPMEAICPSEFATMHTLLKSAKAWLKTNGGGQWIKVCREAWLWNRCFPEKHRKVLFFKATVAAFRGRVDGN